MGALETYKFEGAVRRFERYLTSKWICYTKARSLAEARSRIQYRFKSENNLQPWVKISLEGEIQKVV